MIKIFKPDELSNEEYHAEDKHLSSSLLKELYDNPYQFYKIYIKKSEKKKFYNMDALNFGSFMHTGLFEPHLLEKEYTKDKKETDKIYIPDLKWLHGESLLRSLRNHKVVKMILEKGEPEVSVFTKLGTTPFKFRMDWHNSEDHVIADLKTTSKEKIDKRENMEEVMGSLKYEISAASYIDGYKTKYKVLPIFYFIFISTKDGSIGIGRFSKEAYDDGKLKYQKALKTYKDCKKTGLWSVVDLYIKEKFRYKA